MLPAGRAASGRRGASAQARGPQTVPWQMWFVWLVLNSFLYWRWNAPARSLLPLGEKVRLGQDAFVWRSPDGEAQLMFPAAVRRTAETAWVLSAHNAFRGELVHVHSGFRISLHPLRQAPLVQITRSSRAEGPVQVKINTNKRRLTRNTFVRIPSLQPCVGLSVSLCLSRAVGRKVGRD